MDGFISNLEINEGKISTVESRAEEIIQIAAQREKMEILKKD
jgi:hypothetical protein